MNEDAPAEVSGWGIDVSLIREALKRTPRERFERGIELYRWALELRSARKVVTERTPGSRPSDSSNS